MEIFKQKAEFVSSVKPIDLKILTDGLRYIHPVLSGGSPKAFCFEMIWDWYATLFELLYRLLHCIEISMEDRKKSF